MRPRRSPDLGISTPTLHRVWTGTVVKLLALMVSLGIVAVGATQYQRVALQNTTSGLGRTMSAQARLSSALLQVNDPPAIGMMYGTGNTVAPAKLRAAYEPIRANINAAFVAAGQVMTDPTLRAVLSRADRTWQAMDAAILGAPKLVASGALNKAMAQGRDPNKATVWNRYNAISTDFSALGTDNAKIVQQHNAAQNRTESLVLPIVLGALILGLLLSWFAVRRVKRDVLTPILALRRAALAMRESRLDYVIELDGGTVELQDLASTLNETAVAMGATHRDLRDQARTDELTGLPNRKALTEYLQTMLAEPGERRIGVLFVDVDDFKDVNDTLGHAAGDELLTIAASRLRASTRGDDFVARLGGDEFAIVVDCGNQPGRAITLAEHAVAALNEPVTIYQTTTTVSCSIGIATSDPDDGIDAADELLRNADFAMYMAKSQGKNRYDVFAPSMHTEMLARNELKRDLSRAVQLEQLVLHYQPVVDLASGALRGFEALVRWQHPIRGLLAPSEFVALAEDTGDIIAIGTWVLDQACRDLAALRRDTPDNSTLRMAINVSAHQIATPTFVETVTHTIERHAVPAGAVTLEITEAVALTNTKAAVLALAELRRYGVRVALDDFGIGYSSLHYLHELPIDIIKIDRSFVMDQEGQPDPMLQAIVTLGQSLGLEIIAEGIEKPSELERLRRFANLAGQGYLFARPMPAADATEFGRNRSPVTGKAPLSTAVPVATAT